jgi:hypothetical protein
LESFGIRLPKKEAGEGAAGGGGPAGGKAAADEDGEEGGIWVPEGIESGSEEDEGEEGDESGSGDGSDGDAMEEGSGSGEGMAGLRRVGLMPFANCSMHCSGSSGARHALFAVPLPDATRTHPCHGRRGRRRHG